MEQSVPNAAHQAINVAEAPNKANAYNRRTTGAKAATVLGALHIISGIITILAESAFSSSDLSTYRPPLSLFLDPIFLFVLFFITGGLAIAGANTGNKGLLVATMVMSIISAVFAGILLMYSAMWYRIYSRAEVLIVIGAMMLLIAIASASLTCNQPFCCPSTNQNLNQGTVHCIPNQVPTSV